MESVDLGFYLPWTYSILLGVRKLEKTLQAENLHPSPLQANNPFLTSHLYRVLSGKHFGPERTKMVNSQHDRGTGKKSQEQTKKKYISQAKTKSWDLGGPQTSAQDFCK